MKLNKTDVKIVKAYDIFNIWHFYQQIELLHRWEQFLKKANKQDIFKWLRIIY